MNSAKRIVIASVAAAVVGSSATAAAARTIFPIHPTSSGSTISSVTVTSIDGENSPSAPVYLTSSAYVGILGTSVTVPAFARQLVLAHFNAQMLCSGIPNGWCEGRIVAVPAAGGRTVELGPQQPSGFVLASPPSYWASAEMDRSVTLGAGTWTIQVQARLDHGATSAELQGLNLEVERAASS